VLKTALHAGLAYEDHAAQKIAVGGGALLPLVAPLLAAKSIGVLPDAAFANALGLQKLAAHLSA
jgi:hypothetical protein